MADKTQNHGRTDRQYAILSLAGSQNLCQTMKQLYVDVSPPANIMTLHMMGHLLPGSFVGVVWICLALVSASHFVNKGCRVNY